MMDRYKSGFKAELPCRGESDHKKDFKNRAEQELSQEDLSVDSRGDIHSEIEFNKTSELDIKKASLESVNICLDADICVEAPSEQEFDSQKKLNYQVQLHNPDGKPQSPEETFLNISTDWKSLQSMGKQVNLTSVIVMKTPVSKNLVSDPLSSFTCEDSMNMVQNMNKRVGLVINLSSSTCLYNPDEYASKGIPYFRPKNDLGKVPSNQALTEVHERLADFEKSLPSPNSIALVHSDLGLDQCAYFICSYLVKKGSKKNDALKNFLRTRQRQIKDFKKFWEFFSSYQLPGVKNSKNKALPDRWDAYTKMGSFIENTRILAVKVPLKEHFLTQTNQEDQFTVQDLIETFKKMKRKIGMVVDLTYTSKYYDPQVFADNEIIHEKILVMGKVLPPRHQLQHFKKLLRKFEHQNSNNNNAVIVHCTHGLNRTGYFVCHYLIEELGWNSSHAIKAFEDARGHKIERENYLAGIRMLDCKPSSSHSSISHSRPYRNAWRKQSVQQGNWRRPSSNRCYDNPQQSFCYQYSHPPGLRNRYFLPPATDQYRSYQYLGDRYRLNSPEYSLQEPWNGSRPSLHAQSYRHHQNVHHQHEHHQHEHFWKDHDFTQEDWYDGQMSNK